MTLESGHSRIIGELMRGQATMFVNAPYLGLAGRDIYFRQMLIDLETMEIMAVDPPSGPGMTVSQIVQRCQQLDQSQHP